MVIETLLALALSAHPLHASSALIVMPPGATRGTLTLRVFAEDFPPGREPSAVLRYLEARFHLTRGERRLALTLERERLEGEARIIELSFDAGPGCRAVRVWNGVLTERFEDQVNLVQVRCGSSVRHMIFSRGEGPRSL